MKVKVCGNTSVEQMQQLQQFGVAYAGIIFYEGSKRFIGHPSARQQEAVRNLAIKKVGVFVNAEYDTIVNAIGEYDLYAVQLHGDETDEFCLELMDKAKVIKVFRVGGAQEIDELVAPFLSVCHYFLFDTDSNQYGGSGKQFDWSVLERAKIDKPFFLSGGIGPDDVDKLLAFRHPDLIGVDINSRFEVQPGEKDMKKVEAFMKTINHG